MVISDNKSRQIAVAIKKAAFLHVGFLTSLCFAIITIPLELYHPADDHG